MVGSGNDWTDEMIAYLKEHWTDKGASAKTLAVEIGRLGGVDLSRNSIIGKAHRLGLASKKRGRPGPPTPRPGKPFLLINHKKGAVAPTYYRAVPSDLPTEPTSLVDSVPGQCRYVVTDDPPHLYCPAAAVFGCSWCDKHLRVVSQQPRKLRNDQSSSDPVSSTVVDRPLHDGEAVQSRVGPRARGDGGSIHLSFNRRAQRKRR